MMLPFSGRCQPARSRRGRPSCPLALLLWLAAGSIPLLAQSINTVRQDEFRSRWADYQVDRPSDAGNAEEQDGLTGTFDRAMYDAFKTGPFQLRANLSSGWEFSNEKYTNSASGRLSDSSFFVAPALGVFYNRAIGPLTVSARYSAGYVYYLDPSYLAAGNHGGIFSQTGGLDLRLDGTRSTFSSSASASYGNGNDIESGQLRNLLSISETAAAEYVVTPFTAIGAAAGVTYAKYSGGTVTGTTSVTDSGTIYISYAYSPKTTGRVEFSAGQEDQTATGPGSSGNRGVNSGDVYYYQALFLADYLVAAKLSLGAGVGVGIQNDANVLGKSVSGAHPVYRLTIQYRPTEKTTGSLQFGYEGVDVEPSLQLQVAWQFRLTTSANLSVYQTSNFSDYEVGQNIVTRGVLTSVQQRLFGRVDVVLSGGVEQSEGYGQLTGEQAPGNEKPYYFGGVALAWQLNSYLSFDLYYRGSTGNGETITTQNGLESRAAVSLRLTF